MEYAITMQYEIYDVASLGKQVPLYLVKYLSL